MHKLFEYLCDELKALEKKIESGQTLSMNEIEYAHKLTDMKKNLLKISMLEEDSEYSNAGGGGMMDSYRGGSYARGGRGGRGGGRRGGANQYGSYASGLYSNEDGYSRAEDDFRMELEELMNNAPDDRKRQKIQKLINEMG